MIRPILAQASRLTFQTFFSLVATSLSLLSMAPLRSDKTPGKCLNCLNNSSTSTALGRSLPSIARRKAGKCSDGSEKAGPFFTVLASSELLALVYEVRT